MADQLQRLDRIVADSLELWSAAAKEADLEILVDLEPAAVAGELGERLDHGGGAGLGLTIACSIVTAHGGSIEASANPDGGLTVHVRLRPA